MGRRSLIAAALCVLVTAMAGFAEAADSQRKTVITLARVSDDPVKNLPRLQVMASYLAKRLAHLGITEGRARIAKTNEEMVDLLRSGDVDLMSETVMSAQYFEQNGGAEILLHEWKKGQGYYKSLLIVHKDSDISSIDDLVGRTVAFEDAGSTSGFLVPFALLRERNLQTTQLDGPRAKPPAGQVGYVFSHAEINVGAWIARGLLDAGAISDKDFKDEGRVPPAVRSQLVTLVESPPILRSVLLVNGALDPEIKAAIKQTLLEANGDEEGRVTLKAYYKVKQYTELEGEALANLNRMRQLYGRLNGIF